MTEYIITLINGTMFLIEAEYVTYSEKTSDVRFYVDRATVVARFNMNNIAGWTNYLYVKDKHIADVRGTE